VKRAAGMGDEESYERFNVDNDFEGALPKPFVLVLSSFFSCFSCVLQVLFSIQTTNVCTGQQVGSSSGVSSSTVAGNKRGSRRMMTDFTACLLRVAVTATEGEVGGDGDVGKMGTKEAPTTTGLLLLFLKALCKSRKTRKGGMAAMMACPLRTRKSLRIAPALHRRPSSMPVAQRAAVAVVHLKRRGKTVAPEEMDWAALVGLAWGLALQV
jgi:hypothetical protein